MTIKVAHLTTIDMSVRHLLLNQLLALRTSGFEVAAVSASGPDLVPVAAAGVSHFNVSFTRRMAPLKDLKAFSQLWRLFRRERFTIVHTHQAKAALIGQCAARLAGVPIVVNTLHGLYFHDRTPRLKRRAWIALERFQARFSDLILSQSSEDIDTAVAEGICRREQIEWLGNGIDLERFNPARLPSDTRLRVRASLGLAPNTFVIGFVGRLVREKGLVELFEAFRHVRESIDAYLLVVGPVDADKADAVSTGTAAACGVHDAVFTGYRNDMPELYTAMDVCVLPSYREGYPRALMEASAMGIPSVASNIRGCRDVVQPEENGLLVPVGDSVALSAAIMRIAVDPGLAARMRDDARRRARQLFDEQRVFARVADAYNRLLQRKGFVVNRSAVRRPTEAAF